MSLGHWGIVISVDLANPTQPELDGPVSQYEVKWKHERQLWEIWMVASTCGHHVVNEVLFGFAIRLMQKWINLEKGKQS